MSTDHMSPEDRERLEAIEALAKSQRQFMEVRQERPKVLHLGAWFLHRSPMNHYSDLVRQIREGRT